MLPVPLAELRNTSKGGHWKELSLWNVFNWYFLYTTEVYQEIIKTADYLENDHPPQISAFSLLSVLTRTPTALTSLTLPSPPGPTGFIFTHITDGSLCFIYLPYLK